MFWVYNHHLITSLLHYESFMLNITFAKQNNKTYGYSDK